jgi:hypothetical protein
MPSGLCATGTARSPSRRGCFTSRVIELETLAN